MKTTTRHAIMALAVIALGLTAAKATPIPLTNPSLESGGSDWAMPNDFDGWAESGQTGKAPVAHTGSYGLWNCWGYGWNSLSQQSSYTVASAGETITASVWVRTDSNLGSGTAWFNLTLKLNNVGVTVVQPNYQGGQNWTELTASHVTSAADIGKTVGISFGTDGGPGAGNPGYVYMDDPSLSTVPPAGTVALVWTAAESQDWNLSTPNWTQDATPATWTNGGSTAAEFGATGAGSVILTEPIEANSLVFNEDGYDLAGSMLTLSGLAPQITANRPVLVSSEIAGSAGLAKHGAASLTLAGVNTYSGTTTIGTGALIVGNSLTSGNLGTGDVVNNGSLVFERSDNMTVANVISGAGSLTQHGSGTTTLSAPNSYTGGTAVTGGTLSVTGTGGLYDGLNWDARLVAVNSGATLEFDRWPGSFGIVNYNAGNLVLNGGTLRYTGSEVTTPSFIAGGKAFSLGAGGGTVESAAPTGKVFAITQYSGDPGVYALPAFNSTLILTGAGDGYISKILSGTGGLTKSGTGTWTLAASNTYTGDTTVEQGILQLDHPALAAGSTLTIASGGAMMRLAFVGSATVKSLVLGDTQMGSGTYDATSHPAYFDAAGAGSVVVPDKLLWTAADSRDWNLAEANWTQNGAPATWTNGISTEAEFGATGAGSVILTAPIEANSLVFNEYGYDLSGSMLTLNGPSPKITANQPVTIFSEIAGGAGLAKQGTANLTLAGVNTYSGTTTIHAGRLTVGDTATSGNLGTGDVVNNGSLLFDRSDDVTVAGIISGTGSLIQQGVGSVILTGANTYTGATTVSYGTLELGPTGRLYMNGSTGILAIHSGAALSFQGGWGWGGTLNYQGVAASDNVISGGTLRHTGPSNEKTATGGGRLFTVGSLGATLDSATAGQEFSIGYRYDYGDTLASNGGNLTLTGAGDGDLNYKLPGTGGVIKDGTGTWTLTSANSYHGNTTVNAGSLILAPGGSLSFYPTANQVSNPITGTGSPVVTLNGTLYLDLTGADLTNGNTWTLVDVANVAASYGGSVTSSLGAFNNNAGVWKLAAGGKTWTFSEATGQLTLESDPFDSWINATWPLLTDKTPAGDPDRDGIANLMEYVLQNGDPSLASTAILPTASAAGDDLVFTFHRRNASTADTTQVFQYGSDLNGWTEVTLTDGGMVSITPDTPDAGIDAVIITVPKSGNLSLFGRLKVTK
ncbi:MAG: autotransporter-associated beta strand repeat-containing protein [Verrucomicrobia bacterium]|nr:autotransporter-associated beta strand repeat-containing protein [Verrucomicrobiota bacterium]